MKKVFLSYAREDIEIARRIYEELNNEEDINIWFDEESLSPGDSWEPLIESEISNRDYFILLYSSKSVNKIGFVNAEIKTALQEAKKRNDEQKFIVPLRLDNCEMPYNDIRKYHYVDMFPEEKYEANLKKALKAMGVEPSKREVKILDESNIDYERSIIIWHTRQDKDYAHKVHSFFRDRRFKLHVLGKRNVTSKKVREIMNDAAYFVPLLSDSLNHTTSTDDLILAEALHKHEARKTKDNFIFPIRIEQFSYKKHKKLRDIYPVESTDEKGNDRFREAMNALMRGITNHLLFWDFEANSRDLLENATSDAYERYLSIITDYKKSKEELYAIDYFSAGLNSFAKKNYKEALKRLLLASNHGYNIERPEILNKIAACYIKIDALQKAEDILERALSVDDSYPPCHYNKGIILKENNRYNEAIENFDKAIEKMKAIYQNEVGDTSIDYKGFSKAYNNKATTYKELYKATTDFSYIDAAIEALRIVIDEDNSGLIDYNLACFLTIHPKALEKGSYKEALESIEKSFRKGFENLDYALKDIELNIIRDNKPHSGTFWKGFHKHSKHYEKSYEKELCNRTDNAKDDIVKIAENYKKASEFVRRSALELKKMGLSPE